MKQEQRSFILFVDEALILRYFEQSTGACLMMILSDAENPDQIFDRESEQTRDDGAVLRSHSLQLVAFPDVVMLG
jgi:hypothetical protein